MQEKACTPRKREHSGAVRKGPLRKGSLAPGPSARACCCPWKTVSQIFLGSCRMTFRTLFKWCSSESPSPLNPPPRSLLPPSSMSTSTWPMTDFLPRHHSSLLSRAPNASSGRQGLCFVRCYNPSTWNSPGSSKYVLSSPSVERRVSRASQAEGQQA